MASIFRRSGRNRSNGAPANGAARQQGEQESAAVAGASATDPLQDHLACAEASGGGATQTTLAGSDSGESLRGPPAAPGATAELRSASREAPVYSRVSYESDVDIGGSDSERLPRSSDGLPLAFIREWAAALWMAPVALTAFLLLLFMLGLVLPTGGRPMQPWLQNRSKEALSFTFSRATPAPLPTQAPETTSYVSAVFSGFWMVCNYCLAYFCWNIASQYQRKSVAFNYTPVWAMLVASLHEGTGFVLLTLNYWRPNDLFKIIALTIQVGGGGGYLINALCLRWAGQEFHRGSLWKWCMGTAYTLAAIFLACMLTDNRGPALLIFLGWFEPPLIVVAVSSMVLAAAHTGRKGAAAMTYMQGYFVLWAAHILTLLHDAVPFLNHPIVFPVTRVLSAIGLFIMVYPFKDMVELGMFTAVQEVPRARASWQLKEAHEARYKHRKGFTQFLNPEHLFSFATLLFLTAYLGATTCLFLITRPDMTHDVILHLYHTFHPCVLLDYLPGTLIAQPFFTAGCICQIASTTLCLLRACVFGDVLLILLWALATTVFLLAASQFPLVFTFNPREVSVMSHSVPYMIMVGGSMVFLGVYVVGLWKMNHLLKLPPRRVTIAIFQCSFYIIAASYAVIFMTETLLANLGMGDSAGKPAASLESIKAGNGLDQPVYFNPMSMLTAVLMQILVYSLGMSSPLRAYPVVAELSTHEKSGAGQITPAADEEVINYKFGKSRLPPISMNLKVNPRLPLQVCAFMGMFLLPFEIWLNRSVHGSHVVLDYDWLKFLTLLPGAAVTTCSWTVASVLLCTHAFLVATHELLACRSKLVKQAVLFMAWELPLGTLCAHSGMIPKSPGWFHGFEAFIIIFSAWIVLDGLLVLHHSDHMGAWQIVQVSTSVGVVLTFLFTGLVHTKFSFVLSSVVVFCWAFVDSRSVQVELSNLRIADAVDMIDTHFTYAGHSHEYKDDSDVPEATAQEFSRVV